MLIYDKNNKKLINTLNMQDISVLISRLESNITIIETKPKKFRICGNVIDYMVLRELTYNFKNKYINPELKNNITTKIKNTYYGETTCTKYCDNPFDCQTLQSKTLFLDNVKTVDYKTFMSELGEL